MEFSFPGRSGTQTTRISGTADVTIHYGPEFFDTVPFGRLASESDFIGRACASEAIDRESRSDRHFGC